MHVRPLALLAAVAAIGSVVPVASATVVTSGFSISYSIGANGVSRTGATSNSRFAYLGGNSTTSTNNTFPSFVVYEVNGAAILQQYRNLLFDNNATVTSIESLKINLFDEATNGAAGGFDFSYATNATSLTVGQLTPTFDATDTGGLTTQLGSVIPLGSGTYTPATVTNSALTPYAIGSTLGTAAILADINAGNTFRIVVDANTAATKATLSGYFGLGTFITPPSLTIDATAVPEPATLGLAGVAVASLLGRRRRA